MSVATHIGTHVISIWMRGFDGVGRLGGFAQQTKEIVAAPDVQPALLVSRVAD